MRQNKDNYVWMEIKERFSTISGDQLVSFSTWRDDDKKRYLTVLVKLGYIEKAFVYNRCVQPGYYRKIKDIPPRLKWMKAQAEAKSMNVNLGKRIKKYTLWNHIVDKINNHPEETFNKEKMFPYNNYETGCDLYICKLYKLGYMEKLDRHGNYKILGKIPEKLTASLASKFLYDIIYKRQRKIEKIKEKLSGDNGLDIQ